MIWLNLPRPPLTNFDWGVFEILVDLHEAASGASKMPPNMYVLYRHFWPKGGKSGFWRGRLGVSGSFFRKVSPRKVCTFLPYFGQ